MQKEETDLQLFVLFIPFNRDAKESPTDLRLTGALLFILSTRICCIVIYYSDTFLYRLSFNMIMNF